MIHTILITLLDIAANLAVILVPVIAIAKFDGLWEAKNADKN